jgi:predicted TIM-barrel fold metal-dependent hydrolase
MARNYRIISADGHTLEPPEMWERYLPEEFHKDHLPRVVKDEYGGDSWLAPGGHPSPVGLVATGGQRYEEFRWSGGTYKSMVPGTYDGKARISEMEFDGVDAEVLFPSNSPKTVSYFANHKDPEVHEAGIEAYNTWMLEDFASADPERLIATAMIPQRGIDRSVEALHQAKARGFRTIYLQTFPSGGAKLSRDDDPFWATAEELDMPINIHLMIQPSYRNLPEEVRAKVPDPFAPGAKLPDLISMGGAIGQFSGTIAEFIYSGLFDRFPKLQLVGTEVGASWVPGLLEHMDDHYWRNRTWTGIKLEFLPSEYFRRNWKVTFIREPFAVRVRHSVGVKNMMWSTDYPHHRHDVPYSRRVIEEMFLDVPSDEKSAIIALNAVELYKLPHDPAA